MEIKNIRFDGDKVIVRLESQTDTLVGYQEVVLTGKDLMDKTLGELVIDAKKALSDALKPEEPAEEKEV